jgi:hypothetical protein
VRCTRPSSSAMPGRRGAPWCACMPCRLMSPCHGHTNHGDACKHSTTTKQRQMPTLLQRLSNLVCCHGHALATLQNMRAPMPCHLETNLNLHNERPSWSRRSACTPTRCSAAPPSCVRHAVLGRPRAAAVCSAHTSTNASSSFPCATPRAIISSTQLSSSRRRPPCTPRGARPPSTTLTPARRRSREQVHTRTISPAWASCHGARPCKSASLRRAPSGRRPPPCARRRRARRRGGWWAGRCPVCGDVQRRQHTLVGHIYKGQACGRHVCTKGAHAPQLCSARGPCRKHACLEGHPEGD